MKILSFIIKIILFYLTLTSLAYAYLDPGTSSIILSTIIAFFVAAWAYIKSYYNKIKNFLIKPFNKKNNSK